MMLGSSVQIVMRQGCQNYYIQRKFLPCAIVGYFLNLQGMIGSPLRIGFLLDSFPHDVVLGGEYLCLINFEMMA